MEEELQGLKKILEGPDVPETLDAALTRIEAIPMTVSLIESTQIGQTVGKLRRHSNAQVAEASKRIINSWRNLLKPAASPASSQGSQASAVPLPTPAALKRSSSEVNEDADAKKGKSEVKAENDTPKKSKSSASDLKASTGDSESGQGSSKKAKSEESEKKPVREESTKDLKKEKSTAPLSKSPSSLSDDDQRAKCRAMLEEALATPPLPTAEGAKTLSEVSHGVEEALFNAYDGISKDYRTRFRTLFLNLKNAKSTELRLSLYYGELPFDKLVRMTSDELAPREVQEEKARIAKWQRDAITRSVDASAATDLFRCSKCQQKKCTYFQMQTRSADEPMTSFITCLHCGNRWKIN